MLCAPLRPCSPGGHSAIRIQSVLGAQGDAAVWSGIYNWDMGAFVGDGATFHFPRSAACEPVYCSVAAIGWLDDSRIVAASGAAGAAQPYACVAKAEAVAQFVLPAAAAPAPLAAQDA